MESKKINQLATELAPDLSDLTIIGDPTTGISKKITLSQMASLFTGTVEEYATLAAFPLVGVADTIYIALDTNVIYRYDTSLSAYVILSPNIINSLVFSDANGFDGTITLVGSVATLSITTALTLGSVPFIGASGALTQDNANLFFDDTNNRLGINTNAPTTALDVFGSGIIGRLNATSTNNAYLGFASNGTNKWSAGNVQSDHRFRIFSEANSAELITILQTGEFGIGIANPLTKLHIDGGATALIANLDANVSVAKSISFRSDNSSRINLEVSGTESGSNAGADFFLRTFTDAGSLLETPFTIVRSTGVTTIKSLTLTNVLSVANGGTGSATQNFVDLTTTQSIGGAKTFTSALAGTSATFSSDLSVINTSNALLKVYSNTTSSPIADIELMRGTNTTWGADAYTDYRIRSSGGDLLIQSGESTVTSTRLTISSAGNVGIGVTPFTNGLSVGLDIAGGAGIFGFNNNLYLSSNAYYSTDWKYKATSGSSLIQTGGDGSIQFLNAASGTINTTITFTERMRITSGGFLKASNDGTYYSATTGYHELKSNNSDNTLIMWNSSASPTGIFINYSATPNNTGNVFLNFYDGNVSNKRFAVRSNGGVENYQANNVNLSDERTKKDITPLESYWNKFKAIEIVKFKYKDQTHDDFNIGVIAQQVEKVAPEFVDVDGWDINKPKKEGEEEIVSTEEPLKSIYSADLHHATIKVLQEAMEKIEILEEKIKQLESK